MVPEPARQKPLAPFLLEHLVHEAMILGRVPGETVQHETAALQREGPLPHFPQLVVVLALRLHDGNLVNGGIVQTDVTINGPDRGLGRLGIGDIKAHRARFEQQGTQLRQMPQIPAKDVREGVRHKAQADRLLPGGAHPVPRLLPDFGHFPGNGGIIKEQQHGPIRRHLEFHLGEHVAQDRAEEARLLEEVAEFKRLDGVVINIFRIPIKETIVLLTVGKALEHPAHFLPLLHQRAQVHVRVRNTLGINAAGLGFEFRITGAVRHERDKPTEGALMQGVAGEFLHVGA